jgi:hypothetical protein
VLVLQLVGPDRWVGVWPGEPAVVLTYLVEKREVIGDALTLIVLE